MASVAEKVFSLVKSTVEEQGVSLWDVKFVKEGANHYLRIFIDSDDGIGIDECTNVSHAIDPIIDEADPIDCSYYLEVCSPGINRELTRPEHFEKCVGKNVKIKLFKGINGQKEIIGCLKDGSDEIVIETEEKTLVLKKNECAKIYLED